MTGDGPQELPELDESDTDGVLGDDIVLPVPEPPEPPRAA